MAPITHLPNFELVQQEQFIPLSFTQKRLWWLNKVSPNKTYYTIPYCSYLSGFLDVASLKLAFNQLISRHEILRTVFQEKEGEVQQIILPKYEFNLEKIDLLSITSEKREKEVKYLIERTLTKPFDLSQGPLIRGILMHLREEEYILMITMHNIIIDNCSLNVFNLELSNLYNSYKNNQANPLIGLPKQYADFTLWQQSWLKGKYLEEQLSYWKKQLVDIPDLLTFSMNKVRSDVRSYEVASYSSNLSSELTEHLKRLGQENDASLYMVLLAAFQVLLSRYSGHEDIIVGSPISNHNFKETKGMIGPLLNTLALRVSCHGNPSFLHFLHRVQKIVLDAYDHQDIPSEITGEDVGIEMRSSCDPLFQIMFVFQNEQSQLVLDGLNCQAMDVCGKNSKFDLTLFVVEKEKKMHFKFEYNVDLFELKVIEQMASCFKNLLNGIIADAKQKIQEIELLSSEEHKLLTEEYNATKVDYPHNKTIPEVFESQVTARQGLVAVVHKTQELTYLTLNAQANQWAHYLQKLGVGHETLVALCLDRSFELIVSLLGILKAGGAYVPLDPNYPRERLMFMLDDTHASILITNSSYMRTFSDFKGRIVLLDKDWSEISEHSPMNLQLSARPEYLAYVIYTSGSTGKPKGVMVEHRHVLKMASTPQFRLSNQSTIAQLSSVSFDASVHEIWGALLNGARLVLLPQETLLCSKLLVPAIHENKVNYMLLGTAIFNSMVFEGSYDFSALDVLFIANEALNPECVRTVLHDEKRAPKLLVNAYGPTEATVISTCYPFTSVRDELLSIPIGKPVSNTTVYVLNPSLQLVPIGVVGELYIGGEGVVRGYLNNPELTKERFIANVFASPADRKAGRNLRLYRTGDLVRYLPNGLLDFVGRVDHQVKVRGYRIELGEIETLIRKHKMIKDTVVIVREDRPGQKCLVAYLVSLEGMLVGEKASEFIKLMRTDLEQKLPKYMIPQIFKFLDHLPLTPNGKVDRRNLPLPMHLTHIQEVPYIAPTSPIEQELVEIYTELLNVTPIGINDNFFLLGGHSLLVTQLKSRIRQHYGLELPLHLLFENPILKSLAQIIAFEKDEIALPQLPNFDSVQRGQSVPLSPGQQRLWLLQKVSVNKSVYTIPFTLRLKGFLDIAALKLALDELVSRHEILRTVFQEVEGELQQVVLPIYEFNLEKIDLLSLTSEKQELKVNNLIECSHRKPFDLSKGPLIRGMLMHLRDDEQILMITMHHIIIDGWSLNIFNTELSSLYNSYKNKQSSSLVKLPRQYIDYTLWQQYWLKGELLDRQLTYWKEQLADIPDLLTLPSDKVRPAISSYQGATYSFNLSLELTEHLQKISRENDATLFMMLLAAFQVLLYRYSGQEDLIVGAPIANRSLTELEEIIGFFVNTLALRVSTHGNPTFLQFLDKVRKTALNAYSHQDVPYDQVVEHLGVERRLNYNPVFQVMFVLQDSLLKQLSLDGLCCNYIDVHNDTAQFDLTLIATEEEKCINLCFEYSVDLFEKQTIERMGNHFIHLLNGIVANPSENIDQLSLLTDAEQYELLIDWNKTETEYPNDKTLHQLFEEQVDITPDAVAVVFENQQLTYRELNERSNQVAYCLRDIGVVPERLVAICLNRSLELLIGIIGILKAGGAYVPLDPTYPNERLQFILKDANIMFLVSHTELCSKFVNYKGEKLLLDNGISRSVRGNIVNLNTPKHLAYVIYTSGSTGEPKGVMVEHQSIVSHLCTMNQIYPLTSKDRILLQSPIGFDASVLEIFWPLVMNSAQLVVSPQNAHKDISELVSLIQEKQISVITTTPSLFDTLLYVTADNASEVFKFLRLLFLGGEAVPLDLCQSITKKFPWVTLHNAYGPTETTIDVTYWNCSQLDRLCYVPIGKPFGNTKLYILDKMKQPVPIGVVGELHVAGIKLARGYLNRPELTAEKFIENPFATAEDKLLGKNLRLYRTGDLARYLADGNIHCVGRIDHQVKLRGCRIELGEIEAKLCSIKYVKEAVVILQENNGGEKSLVGYITLVDKQVPTDTNEEAELVSSIRQYLEKRLPEYMIPSAFVVLDSIPLTTNGKINRQKLPSPKKHCRVENFVAPRTELEKQLVNIYSQLLKIPDTNISIHDNFFKLGGYSLLVVRMAACIWKKNIAKVPIWLFFENPTVKSLAEKIEEVIHQEKITGKKAARYANIDFLQEAKLDLSILLNGTRPQTNGISKMPKKILLTGATGYIGVFVLYELLQKTDGIVYCLIRAENEESALDRICQTLKLYLIWDTKLVSRIVPVVGDLGKPLLGIKSEEYYSKLTKEIQAIYHCATEVNFIKSYVSLKSVNVVGMIELLKFAATETIKPFHHVSTVGVFGFSHYFRQRDLLKEEDEEENPIMIGLETLPMDIGYVQTKWVTEKLVWEAIECGLPAAIYRPGFVLCHSQTGAANSQDFFVRFISDCVRIKCFPSFSNLREEFVTVDFVSQAIVHISGQGDCYGKAFHLVPDKEHNITTNTLFDLINSIGYSLEMLSFPDWRSKMVNYIENYDDSALAPLMSLLTEEVMDGLTDLELFQNSPHFENRNTKTFLSKSDIEFPVLDQVILKNYFSYLSKTKLGINHTENTKPVSLKRIPNGLTSSDYTENLTNGFQNSIKSIEVNHLSPVILNEFAQNVSGKVVHQNDDDYEALRQRMIWNGRKFPRFPKMIVQAHTEEDIIKTVHFARRYHTRISVRGRGLSFSGTFMQDDGILLDLSNLQNIEINIFTNEAKVQPGVTAGVLNERLAQVGLAFPTGYSSKVSISGFLLGGGAGINSGAWGNGKSVFNIKAIDVVTADGEYLHASPSEHSDLYWAARGGGPGLFFIVTRFYLQCYPIPGAITTNTYIMPFSKLPAIIAFIENVSNKIEPNLQLSLIVTQAPEGLIEKCTVEDYARVAILSTTVFAKNESEAQSMQELLALHPSLPKTLVKTLNQPTSIEEIYRENDDMLIGQRWAVDNILTNRINDAVEILMKYLPSAPSEFTMPLIAWEGNPVFPEAAYSVKGYYFISTYGQWIDAKDDEANCSWLQNMYDELENIASGSYINEFDIETRILKVSRCYSPENWSRLQFLRQKYDPDCIFHNIFTTLEHALKMKN